MLDLSKLQKLTVGDIADYERHRKEIRKAEIIGTIKDLYGDNVPIEAVGEIERQLKTLPRLEDGGEVKIDDACFLIWMSLKKSDNDVTIEQVGKCLDMENLESYMSKLFPQPSTVPAKKKTVRKKKVKNN